MYETTVVGQTEVGIEIFRITFDDGRWWELHSIRTWGTAQAVRQATLGYDAEIDSELLKRREAENVAALNGSTVKWSWGVPTTNDYIRSLPGHFVEIAAREMHGRHIVGILSVDDDKKKASRWRWLWTSLSRITGRMLLRTGRA